MTEAKKTYVVNMHAVISKRELAEKMGLQYYELQRLLNVDLFKKLETETKYNKNSWYVNSPQLFLIERETGWLSDNL